jgi:hypothetical protein
MNNAKIENGDLVKASYNKYTPRAIRVSIGRIYGCYNPTEPHDHGECMFYSDNNLSDNSYGIVIKQEKCNSSLLSKTKDFSEKPIIDIWFYLLAYDRLEKILKKLWIREKDISLISKLQTF